MVKPVIVFAHGAWHQPLHYLSLLRSIQAKGHTVVSPVNATLDLKGLSAGKTCQDDTKVIRDAMRPFLESGEDIVLVCHSYGGIPGTDAVEGNTVQERAAKGLKGGVKSVVYIASSALPQRGMCIFDMVGGGPEPWWDSDGTFGFPNQDGFDKLYSDVDSVTKATCTSALVRQSIESFRTPNMYSAPEVKAPLFYVVCDEDQLVPPAGQKALAEACKAKTIHLSLSHSPFLTDAGVRQLMEFIDEATGVTS